MQCETELPNSSMIHWYKCRSSMNPWANENLKANCTETRACGSQKRHAHKLHQLRGVQDSKWVQRQAAPINLNTCIFVCCNLNYITTSSMMHPNLWNSCIASMILSEQVESLEHGGKCLTCGNWPGAKLSMAGAGAAGVARPALRSGASTACLASGAQSEGREHRGVPAWWRKAASES